MRGLPQLLALLLLAPGEPLRGTSGYADYMTYEKPSRNSGITQLPTSRNPG